MRKSIILLSSAVLMSGCAYVNTKRVNPGEQFNGVPFYGEKPLLQVDGSGAKIVIVPNTSERYAIRFGAFLASNNFNIERRENGTLAKIGANIDSSAALKELRGFAESLLEDRRLREQVEATNQTASGPAIIPSSTVLLYEFIFDDDGTIEELRPISINSAMPPIATEGNPNLKPDNRDPLDG